MNARTLAVLTWNGFREARRNRVTVVVFLFAFVMIFSGTVALQMTVATFDRVMTDLGLGTMSLISAFLAIFLASGLIPREIERRTIYMVLAKPVSRSAFMVGRYLGNLVTVLFVTGSMAGLFVAQLVAQGSHSTAAHWASFVGLMLQVIVISAVAFAFASSSSQFVTAVASVGLYSLGHLASDLYSMAERSKVEGLRWAGRIAYYVIPNLDRLDFKVRATYNDPTSASDLWSALAYAVSYSTVLVTIACLLFERRDFK